MSLGLAERFELSDLAVVIRSRAPDRDDPMIYSAWLRGHREQGDWPCRVSSRRYFERYKYVIESLMRDGTVIVAASEQHPDRVLGFACALPNRGLLHWIYVKQIYRRCGVARALLNRLGLAAAPVTCTNWTRAAQDMARAGAPWTYDPFWIHPNEISSGLWSRGERK